MAGVAQAARGGVGRRGVGRRGAALGRGAPGRRFAQRKVENLVPIYFSAETVRADSNLPFSGGLLQYSVVEDYTATLACVAWLLQGCTVHSTMQPGG